jgi:hypothetical protein
LRMVEKLEILFMSRRSSSFFCCFRLFIFADFGLLSVGLWKRVI